MCPDVGTCWWGLIVGSKHRSSSHSCSVLCSGRVLGSLWYPPLVSSGAVAVLAVPTFSSCPQFRELWMSQRLWGGWGSGSVWKRCLRGGGVYVPFHPGINQPYLVLTQTMSRAGTKMHCCSAGAGPNLLGYTVSQTMAAANCSWCPGSADDSSVLLLASRTT